MGFESRALGLRVLRSWRRLPQGCAKLGVFGTCTVYEISLGSWGLEFELRASGVRALCLPLSVCVRVHVRGCFVSSCSGVLLEP